jgi:hypothetical protein
VALLEFAQDRKNLHRVFAAQRQFRHVPQDHVRKLEVEIFQRLLRKPDVLRQVESALFADAGFASGFHDRCASMTSNGGL